MPCSLDHAYVISFCSDWLLELSREPGIRWHLPVLPTTLARLALRAQARRKEKGCPYISSVKFMDKVVDIFPAPSCINLEQGVYCLWVILYVVLRKGVQGRQS